MMNIQTILLIVLAALVVIAVAVVILLALHKLRSRRLKETFGPEYDYTLERFGDQHTAESDLREREKRVVNFNIRPLSQSECERYHTDWIETQANFVDDPSGAVGRANRLITEVMIARGFPVADFEQRSVDLSVLYPNFVQGYREATAIATRNHTGSASTEDLRQAMINFHSLFDELVSIVDAPEKELEDERERQPISR
jgi:hypothetical protein